MSGHIPKLKRRAEQPAFFAMQKGFFSRLKQGLDKGGNIFMEQFSVIQYIVIPQPPQNTYKGTELYGKNYQPFQRKN
jgi:hypothetical protein